MIFYTATHFINESPNEFIFNRISYTKSLTLPAITNKLIRKKLDTNNSIFISAVITKDPDR